MGRRGFGSGQNVRHFRLVNRSVLNEGETDRVFVEVNPKKGVPLGVEEEEEVVVVDEPVDVDSVPQAGEAAKYGIFYDDCNYDYTQHLRPIGVAPDAVFVPAKAKIEEEEIHGHVIEAGAEVYDYSGADEGVREVLDALNDDEYCGEFDDDLVVKLNRDDDARVLLPMLHSEEEDDGDDYEDYLYDSDGKEEEEPPFNGIKQLDEIRQQLKQDDKHFMERVLRYQQASSSDDDDDEYVEVEEVIGGPDDRFDCQSILSTLNTGINLPTVIAETIRPIRLSQRTGLPARPSNLSMVAEEDDSGSENEDPVNKGVARRRDETAEEKRARKAAAKAEQKEKRLAKKSQA